MKPIAMLPVDKQPVAEAAREVALAVNRISAENSQLRTEADAEINRQVIRVNDALKAVQDINRKIANLGPQGVDTSGLQDERHRIIDGISSIVPVRTVKRDGDQVAIYAANGAPLLDGRLYELSFQLAPNVVTADMTIGAPLGRLMQDQGAASGPVAIDMGAGGGLMDGGSLSALFEVRDRIVPEFDAEMDRYANDLIERFRDLMPPAALDGSGNGLFVDRSPGPLTGLAGRLQINAAVDPGQPGGAVWWWTRIPFLAAVLLAVWLLSLWLVRFERIPPLRDPASGWAAPLGVVVFALPILGITAYGLDLPLAAASLIASGIALALVGVGPRNPRSAQTMRQ